MNPWARWPILLLFSPVILVAWIFVQATSLIVWILFQVAAVLKAAFTNKPVNWEKGGPWVGLPPGLRLTKRS